MNNMRGILDKALFFSGFIFLIICSNCFFIVKKTPTLIPVLIMLFIISHLLFMYSHLNFPNYRFKICNYGVKCLKSFVLTTVVTIILHIIYISKITWLLWLSSVLIATLIETLIFWVGIICVYCTSTQLGIKYRILGLVFGYVPIMNLVMLHKIIKVTALEIKTETDKHEINEARKTKQICRTQYPILLVHGVFFRDSKYRNYWGRIPKELEKNGAKIFYGNHQSALSVKDSAREICDRVKQIVTETKCEKVNIIAHSKGGMDCRYAISNLGLSKYVASLTTINTPHRGCKFADYILESMSEKVKEGLASKYNSALKKLGDNNPDFMSAVYDLTSSRCSELEKEMLVPEGVYCSSVGSKLNRAIDGKFPLNFSYCFVNKFDGGNDGLVSVQSFSWGEKYVFINSDDSRGISHGDVIDLNRENMLGFDVREFYVQLVFELKCKGF